MTLCFGWDKSERGHNSITKKQSEWHKNCGAKFASSTINGGNWATCTVHVDVEFTVANQEILTAWIQYGWRSTCQSGSMLSNIVWLKYEGIKDQKKCLVLIFHLVLFCHMYIDVHITSISCYMYVVMSLVWTRLKDHGPLDPESIAPTNSKATLLPCELQEQSSNISYLEISLKF